MTRTHEGREAGEGSEGHPSAPQTIEWLNAHKSPTLGDSLGIKVTGLTPAQVTATMPVDGRTHQPFGLLHGGASVALAETVASLGAVLHIDPREFAAVGLEINANHLRAVREGIVTGVAKPIHIGRSTHVWEVIITDTEGRKVCVSRCTIAIVPLGAVSAAKVSAGDETADPTG